MLYVKHEGNGLMWMNGSEILDVTWYPEVLMTVTANRDGGWFV
jgi:hypothetical protein